MGVYGSVKNGLTEKISLSSSVWWLKWITKNEDNIRHKLKKEYSIEKRNQWK